MPTDKSGKRITWGEFFSRWKRGISGITPFQAARVTYFNTYIMLFGILMGLGVSIAFYETMWWIGIILAAAFVNVVIVQLGNYQKYQLLKGLETNEKEVENEQESIH